MDFVFRKEGGQIADIRNLHKWIELKLATIKNGGYCLSISRQEQRRSLSQNALMWLWFTCISRETGQPIQDIHDYYCTKFLKREIVIFTGENVEVTGGTKNLNTAEFTRFMDSVQADAATELGIMLPLPSDIGYEDFVDEFSKKNDV